MPVASGSALLLRRRQFAALFAAAPLASGWRAVRDQYRKDLFDDYLPFHVKYVVDPQFGGFHCTVTPQGQLISPEKTAWYEGRGTWVFSFLYNNLARDQKYLDIAARSIKIIERARPSDPTQHWPRAIQRDGSPAGPPDSEVYSDLFIAEGMAEFAKAARDNRYWDEAKRIVLNCVRLYDRPDYHPIIGRTYLGPDAPPFPGARVLGVWMVLLRATTQMLATRPDADLKAVNDRCLDAILNRHFNPRFQLCNELINHDFSRPTGIYEKLVYAGHAIETLWMVIDEAIRRKDKALYARAAALFERHCEVSRDRVYGGLFRNLRDVDANDWTTDKTLFPHQEALIGSLLMVEQTNLAWARDFYREIDAYTRAHFPMKDIGSPLWQVIGDRQVTRTPGMQRAENYHHARFLMLNLLTAERLAKAPSALAR